MAAMGLTISSVRVATGSGLDVIVSSMASMTLTTGSGAAGMTFSTTSLVAVLVVEAPLTCALSFGFWVLSLMASFALTTGQHC